MTKSKRTYSFVSAGIGSDLGDLADKYPLKQTQALILTIEETLDWVSRAARLFGNPPHECLKERSAWLLEVERSLKNLLEAIDEEEDLAACELGADDAWYDVVDELCRVCPDDDLGDEGKLYEVIDRLSFFWLNNVYHQLANVKSVMSGDGEVLAILANYKRPSRR